MTRITPYLALALLGLTGCNTDSVRRASAQQIPATQTSASDMRPASGPQQAYELRRVWSGSRFDFHWNEPSPDGRYISEIQWWSGNLAVTDLVTGEMVPVTGQTEWEGNAYGSVFSPDGKQLAYRWAVNPLGAGENVPREPQARTSDRHQDQEPRKFGFSSTTVGPVRRSRRCPATSGGPRPRIR